MAFVKLDCGILNSTLWFDRDVREVFITALLMAEPWELLEAAPQIEVDSLELTRWVVPPGWYGLVPAAGVGIIRQAGLDRDVGMAALRALGDPEQDSRSRKHDGRRLVRIDGGFLVLNYFEYRDRDHSSAIRSQRYRMRKKERDASRVIDTPTRVSNTQAEAYVEAEAYAEREREAEASDSLSCIEIPEIPNDMDAKSEWGAATFYHRDKGQPLTVSRWRSWVLAGIGSGRYAKRKKGPATQAEMDAFRRECIARMEADGA